jgi:WD40 repeat protein
MCAVSDALFFHCAARSIRFWAEEPGSDDWECVQALPGAAAAAKEAAAAVRAAAKAAGTHADADALAAAAADAAAAAARDSGGHASSVWAVTFSPDGTLMASASDDGSLHFWHAAHGEPACTVGTVPEAHDRSVFATDWAPSGGAVASAGGDNALRVWAPASGGAGATLLAVALQAHPADVNAVRWHPKRPGLLATAADDGNVKLWLFDECDSDADADAMSP